MKIAIAQRGDPKTGKTTTIRLVFERCVANYPDAIVEHLRSTRKEIAAIVTIGKVRIGFESMGDPGNKHQRASLKRFVSDGCRAVLCACRTGGVTHHVVAELEASGYELDWRDRSGVPTNAGNKVEVDYALTRLREVIAEANHVH